jgi:hypothetical protein
MHHLVRAVGSDAADHLPISFTVEHDPAFLSRLAVDGHLAANRNQFWARFAAA